MTRRPNDQYFTPTSACEVLKAHWQGWDSSSALVEPWRSRVTKNLTHANLQLPLRCQYEEFHRHQ